MAQVRLSRKNAISLEEAMNEFIREMKLSSGLNTRRVFAAWDAVSGASAHTLKQFFRDGTLYVTLSSAVWRRELSLRKASLIAGINDFLAKDSLFVKDDPKVGEVKEIVLK
ncbi:MAG: DUF721 domain-containing protein [Bacteroidales bacterium]|nr:DUF721 domain-containing protein [Bacteroidales bacterium]